MKCEKNLMRRDSLFSEKSDQRAKIAEKVSTEKMPLVLFSVIFLRFRHGKRGKKDRENLLLGQNLEVRGVEPLS